MYALKKCAVLESELFSDCHGLVAVAPFVERCTADTCACTSGGDCECLCTALAAYGQACSLRGVHIRWRSNNLCREPRHRGWGTGAPETPPGCGVKHLKSVTCSYRYRFDAESLRLLRKRAILAFLFAGTQVLSLFAVSITAGK